MSNTTVSKLATALKISPEKLISQLNEAGVNVDKEVDEIIKVIQDGYLIKDRLLRPASVIIAKKEENKKK